MQDAARLTTFDYDQRLPGLGFRLPARMTVLPLADGKLALVSPVPMDDALAAQVAALGEVAYLIAPNLLHHLYLGAASARFPAARVLAPSALRGKRPDLRIDGALERDVPAELSDFVEVLRLDGAPSLDEFALYHRVARALVVTDLVFNVTRPRGFVAHLVLRLVGCHGRLATSRAARLLFRDRAAALKSAQRLLSLPFETLVMAHGDIVTEDARARLSAALSWLRPRARLALPRSHDAL